MVSVIGVSNLIILQNHLEGLFKHRLLSPRPRGSDSACPGGAQLIFRDDAGSSGSRITV